jgi:hypothetical protein
MDEIIAGFPLYLYYVCFSFQFAVFPLLSLAYNQYLYKAAFIGLMVKDWVFAPISMDIAMSVHHIIGIWATYSFCNTQQLSWIITVGEFGSGTYNIYTLAKHYDVYVYPIYVGYAVIMTMTNIYCVVGIIRAPVRWYYKIPCIVLLCGRQYFVYTS